MRVFRKGCIALAGIVVLLVGLAGMAAAGSIDPRVPFSGGNAGGFGVPDPTVGAAVLGWFDIAVSGNDDVLPVMVNASNNSYPAGATGHGVHFIVWNVRSQHVWDKDIAFTPWDVESLSIRDTINNMPPAQRNLLIVTLEDGTQRYQGYFTAITVFEFPGNLLPGVDDEYPFLYANDLGGWVYLTNLLEGQADGYSMVSIEAATLWAGSPPIAFMMSFSADFWNRYWWWTYRLATFQGAVPTVIHGWYSRLWNCSLNQFWYRDNDSADIDELPDTPYQDSKVFERYDAGSGINAQLLTRGVVITTDDAWLGKTMRVSTPYDKGGMLLIGRYFKDEAASIANSFANKLVLWADRNGEITGTRQVQAVVYDEEENAISLPIFFPDELTVLQLDELVGTNPAGIIVLNTRQIQYSNGQNPIMDFLLQDYAIDAMIDLDLPSGCGLNTFIHANLLQLLGWTTTQALAEADLTWGAAFLMLRDYEVGTPAVLSTFIPGIAFLP